MAYDLHDAVFGRLTVVERTESVDKRSRWRCRCSCGTEVSVLCHLLVSGKTKSCGCYRREMGAARGKTINLKHGEGSNGEETPEYRAWSNMLSRCNNTNHRQFPNYGGRGISVCSQWSEYKTFIADVGRRPSPAHSIDRINNSGNYEPGNVRWATRTEQNRNTRAARIITINGRTAHLSVWLTETGTPRKTFYNRLKAGRSEAEALGLL